MEKTGAFKPDNGNEKQANMDTVLQDSSCKRCGGQKGRVTVEGYVCLSKKCEKPTTV